MRRSKRRVRVLRGVSADNMALNLSLQPVEDEAKRIAAEEAKKKADEARKRAEEEARLRAEAEAKRRAEEEAGSETLLSLF